MPRTVKESDPHKAVLEIRAQLASDERKLLFLFGAGASMSVGLPSLISLTTKVEENLPADKKKLFQSLRSLIGKDSNIEQVLNRVRLIRELLGSEKNKEYDGISGEVAAKEFDKAICDQISDLVDRKKDTELRPFLTFGYWLYLYSRRRPQSIELFTLNYDLLVERALEKVGVPYFDGFIGTETPFFFGEAVEGNSEDEDRSISPPPGWIRLWKIHGSVNWYCDASGKLFRSHAPQSANDLMIFPSREKYSESRKQPFMAFQDRFRRQLCRGETLLTIIGYSFSDQHINEIVRYALKTNPRLAVNILAYGEPAADGKRITAEVLLQLGRDYRNCSVYGPDGAVIGGEFVKWKLREAPESKRDNTVFWDEQKQMFLLGDFNKFTEFLNVFMKLEMDKVIAPSPSAGAPAVATKA